MASCPPPLVCSAGAAPASSGVWDDLLRLSNIGLSWYDRIAGPPQPPASPAVNIPQQGSKQQTSFFSSNAGQLLIVGGVVVAAILVLRRL
jgi:hypothetical protein